jgi:hypothetical protein
VIVDRERIAQRIGEERYERGRALAWAAAPGTGTRENHEEHRETGYELREIVNAALEVVLDLDEPAAASMRKACALYRDFPSYSLLAGLFNTIGYDSLSPDDSSEFCRFLGRMLDAPEAELADPAAYLLWVDYFEVEERVDAAWMAVSDVIATDRGIERLLLASGPVPERLKLPLFERLLLNENFHAAILKALSRGVFDMLGRIERATIVSFLGKLHGDRSSDEYTSLIERLADPAPIELGWQLKDG